MFYELHLKAKSLRIERKKQDEKENEKRIKTAEKTSGSTIDDKKVATMCQVQQDSLFTLNLPVEHDDGEEMMIKLIKMTAEGADVASSTALYDLFHFLLDYLKYLHSSTGVIRKMKRSSIIKWLQYIASTFLTASDRDVRRRAFQIVLLSLTIVDESERVLLHPYYLDGLLKFVEMINDQSRNSSSKSLVDWWRQRKQNPICEFMLDCRETRDLNCIKLAVRLALELYFHHQGALEMHVEQLMADLGSAWELEIIALFSDHDSELLLVLSKLLHVATPRSNFKLLLSFLDSINFDHESLLDLLLVDPDTLLLYLQGILCLIAEYRMVFEQYCLEKSLQGDRDTCKCNEIDKEIGEVEDQTDYLSSTASTVADLLGLIQKTGHQLLSQVAPSQSLVSNTLEAFSLAFPSFSCL